MAPVLKDITIYLGSYDPNTFKIANNMEEQLEEQTSKQKMGKVYSSE